MARVAIVETYPYEAVWGGDAVYLDRIRTFLIERGHQVDSYVTDITRGRSNPTLALPLQKGGGHRWHVRNAVSLGEGRFCSIDPRLLGQSLRRLPGRRAAVDHEVSDAEGDWLVDRLTAGRPDLVILAFGACAFTRQVASIAAQVIALKGFFSDRRVRLGEPLPTPVLNRTLLEQLGHATRVGFNNRHDLDFYTQQSGSRDGILIGMGFPDRLRPPAIASKALLFVGADTTPNVESLQWFLDRVWPLIRDEVPDCTVRVAGSVGAAFAGQMHERVAFLGFVESLDAEYANSALAIAPLVSGSSGVKTKIAEALSYGRPVVTTSLGIDPGEPTAYGRAVIVADVPEAFAATVVATLGDPTERISRTKAAAEQFHRQFAEDMAYHEIVELLGTADLVPKTMP